MVDHARTPRSLLSQYKKLKTKNPQEFKTMNGEGTPVEEPIEYVDEDKYQTLRRVCVKKLIFYFLSFKVIDGNKFLVFARNNNLS